MGARDYWVGIEVVATDEKDYYYDKDQKKKGKYQGLEEKVSEEEVRFLAL